ncbi:MAG: archaemetzincin [Promethearchaeota archaeon]
MTKRILLLKIGQVDKLILVKLKKNLEWVFKDFRIKVRILPNELDLKNSYYHLEKKKYNANRIIEAMNEYLLDYDFFRVLGILNEDIYSGTFNFIFGCADGIISKIALISVTRLDEVFYSRTEDKSLFEKRILKEAIHELGHTFGLSHCQSHCVMQFSNSLMEADNKPIRFCKDCLQKLELFLNKT